jgi:tetratricopeptide (TPR) repeat protein
MYINLWDWFKASDEKARAANNTQRLQLKQIYRRGWDNIEIGRSDEARAEFERGYKLAQQLDEPWWELYFGNWICETITHKRQYIEALDVCMKQIVKMQHPRYQEHPHQAVIYYRLAQIYFAIDALGYEAEIDEALHTIENGMPLDRDTHQRVYFLRAAMPYKNEDWNTAYERLLEYLSCIEGDPFRQRSGYNLKADIHYARGELEDALASCKLREEVERRSKMATTSAYAVIWQGIFSRYLGNESDAAASYQRGMVEYANLKIAPDSDSEFYRLAALYHAIGNNLEEALALQDKELAIDKRSGSVDDEFYCRLNRCYLLNRMQKPLGEEVVELERLANQHRKPAFFLKKVEEVKQGRCYPYDWQIAERKA